MKLCTRKFLAGLLSFGMLLQVASPLSALAADSSLQGGTLTISCANELLATMNRAVDGTLSWENDYNPFEGVQIEYDTASRTYKFNGTLTPPKNGYMTMKTDSAEDSIYIDGGNGKAVDGTVYVGLGESTVKNVTITSGNSETTVAEYAVVTATGEVKLSNTGGGQVASQAVTEGKPQSVSIVGGNSTVPTADVFIWVEDASGNVNIANNAEDGLVAGGRVRIKADGDVDIKGGIAKTSRDSTESTVMSGGKVMFDANASSANALKDMSLTVSADDAVTLKSHSNNSFLSGEKAYIDVTAPSLTVSNDGSGVIDGNVKFTRTNTADDYRVAVGESETENTQMKMDDTVYSETVQAKYLNIQPGAPENSNPDDEVTQYGITVTLDNGTSIEVTSKNCDNILGTEYTDGKLVYDSKVNTLTGTGSFGALEINANSATVNLSNAAGATTPVVNGALTINNANNITVTAADGTVAVNGKLTVNGANNVTVAGNRDQTGDSHYGTIIDGDVDITCTNDVLFENKGNGDVIGGVNASTFKIDAHNVTVKGNSTGQAYPVYGSVNITSTGDVLITGEHTTAVSGKLEVGGADKVTVTGNGSHSVGDDADISCSGTVILENKSTGSAVDGTLTYKPVSPAKSYVVKAGTDAANAESEEPIYTNEEGESYSGTIQKPYISITPDYVPTDDTTVTTDPGSTAGGAVAAVVVGGAAIMGGYEITTRVILHNILPEGAAIPANRGQLALLIWNNADRPEPANEPAFADVADADMAKAAQWCVEQGIMDAKTEDTFKPEGWTPKFKVIETWNKAFPAAK